MKILILWAILLGAVQARAFINVETLRVRPVEGYAGSLDASGQFQTGNTEKNIFHFSALNRYQLEKNEFLAVANYTYGETSHVKDTHKGSAHLRYTRELRENFSGEIFGQIEFDRFRSLTQRDLVGAGGRFRLVHRGGFFLFSGVGFFAENEQITVDPNESDFRGNLYLSLVYDNDSSLKTSLVAYFQPLWDELTDHRLNVNFDLENPLYKNLSLLLSYNYQFDNRPPSDVKKYDSLALIGLRWHL